MGCLIRLLKWLLLIAVVLAIALWFAAPPIAAAIIRTRLPADLRNGFAIADVATTTPDLVVEARGELPTSRAHMVLGGVVRRWLPPGLIRDGHAMHGTWRPTDDETIAWLLCASRLPARPTVRLRVGADRVNRQLADHARLSVTIGSIPMEASFVIDRASFGDDPPTGDDPRARTLRFSASGTLTLGNSGQRFALPIERLAGHADIVFSGIAGGWRPTATIAIDALETPLWQLDMIASARDALGHAITARLADRLQDAVVPPWFPLDVRVSGTIDPVQPATPAAGSAPVLRGF